MTRIFHFALVITTVFLTASCDKTTYQVVQVKKLPLDEQKPDAPIQIEYDLWSEGGRLVAEITNETDQDLYISWDSSQILWHIFPLEHDILMGKLSLASSGQYDRFSYWHKASVRQSMLRSPSVTAAIRNNPTLVKANTLASIYLLDIQFPQMMLGYGESKDFEENISPLNLKLDLRFGPTIEECWIYSHHSGVYAERIYCLERSESPESFRIPMAFYTTFTRMNPFSQALFKIVMYSALILGGIGLILILQI